MELTLALVTAALVKAAEFVNKKEWSKLGKMICIAAGGALFYFGGVEPSLVDAIAAALSASGMIVIAGYAGEKANSIKQ